MRNSAVAIATALVLAMISPAFAQPFADTPTNHWAYDAIAELAAKGLIEGYPDGTFKGDRAMTRYEMAMVVARLLARIESIQIPAPTPQIRPEVGRSDVDTILRLVNEFRAELAAKNVRLTAVEEELNAIKARLDNVKIRGRYRFRDDATPSVTSGGAGIPGNGNTNTGTGSIGATILRARQGFKIEFDGSVAPDVHAIISLETFTSTSTPLTFNSGNASFSPFVADAFFDWKNIWGTPIEMWLGHFGGGQNGFRVYPVQFGPYGLVLNTNTHTWGASTANTGNLEVDGLWLSGHWAELADLQVQGTIIRVAGSTGSTTFELGEDAYGIDASIRLMQGLRAGGYYLSNTINSGAPSQVGVPNALWHVYGGTGPSWNPVTSASTALPGCISVPVTGAAAASPGIGCAAAGSGYGAYVAWDIIPGVHLDGEFANWNDSVHTSNDSAFIAGVTWDLANLIGGGHNLTLVTYYTFMGTNFYAPYGVEFDNPINGSMYPGNAQGFTGIITYDLFDNLSLLGAYITGNNVSNGQAISQWHAGFTYKFAPGTSVTVYYETYSLAGITQANQYRAEMNYNF